MPNQQESIRLLKRFFDFLLRVVRGFMRNKGLLLSGALAYYILLSIVPLSILALIILSHFVKEEQLFNILSTYTGMLIPGYAAILAQQVQIFLNNRHTVGIIGFLVMLFFSSMAFGVLQSAMSIIFMHRSKNLRRHFLTSAVIPYLFILLIGLGIILVSFITGALEILEKRELIIIGWTLSLKITSKVGLYALGLFSEMFLISSIYLVMPVGRIKVGHALIGGITATILWEITRHVLIWYYSTLSMVNVIYGSLATAVVTLLITEAIALILLLGAQIIAELESKANESSEVKLSGSHPEKTFSG